MTPTAQEEERRAALREIDEGKRALEFLAMKGYQRCNIAACNCPYWHGGNASERLSEIHDILSDAGLEPYRKTAIKAIEELISRAQQPATVSLEWQPIETAPKDGAWFLGFNPDSNMCWAPYELISWTSDYTGEYYFCEQDTSERTECTHWMPLPKPPSNQAAGSEN